MKCDRRLHSKGSPLLDSFKFDNKLQCTRCALEGAAGTSSFICASSSAEHLFDHYSITQHIG
ncbi:hypothetical protein TYRP_015420 [Tyrophagus putrescentiae]|nr:hypothetical protein TYRP_019680 [Tyrophagus putrescentiae]KAH9397998.1 hypothetical protein TYRP_019371 [Tyrophagus putrescentiae]KAH9402672.1 hypothetical protein TYRP_015420 [Tyrophagus putrescentiae]